MSQVARVQKFEETKFVNSTRQPLPANPPILPLPLPKTNFFVWKVFFPSFWPKTIGFLIAQHI